MSQLLARLAAGVLALAIALPGAAPASAETAPVQLDIASTFPPSLPMLGDGMRRMMEQVARASAGSLVLRLHEPGVLVPGAETVKAVSEGRVDAAWAGAGWFAGSDSAFNMFSTVPFGPATSEYLAWMYHGGGLELARGMFARHGLYNIPCAIMPPEASGFFRREIRTVEEFRGLRMRFYGLGAQVMDRLGAVVRQLPPGEIPAAMASGEIEAAEFSVPSMDLPLGLHRYARYYYFPGWHQQATLFDLFIGLDRWRSLSEQHRTLIEMACGDTMRDLLARAEAEQWQALRDMQSLGVQLRRWSPEILVAFEDAWNEVAAEEVRRNPSFARVWQSYDAFRSNYATWRRMNFLQ